MQQKIKCRWLHRSFVFLLSILVATSFMMPGSFGAFGAEKANAATPTVLNDLTYIQVTDDGEITSFNVNNPNYPKDIIIPRFVMKNGEAVTIKKIGDIAFASAGLNSVQFGTASQPSAIEEIGVQAFKGSSLSSLTLPAGLKTMGGGAFQDAGRITTLDMSNLNSLEKIPADAFLDTRITNLKLPKYVTFIGARAFSGTRVVNLAKIEKMTPSHEITIKEGAFDGFDANAVIDLSDFAPNSIAGAPWTAGNFPAIVKWSDAHNINNPDNPDIADKPSLANTKTPFLFDTEKQIIYGLKDDLFAESTTNDTYDGWDKDNAELIIPSKIGDFEVLGFADGALANSIKNQGIKTIKFGPDHTMDEIPDKCFYNRSDVEEIIDFPSSIKTIGNRGMQYMSALKHLVLPGVTKVESYGLGFGGTGKCEYITFETSEVPNLVYSSFSSMPTLTDINLRNIQKDAVKGAPWSADYSTVHWANNETTMTEVINVTVDGKPWSYRIKDKRLMQYLGELKHDASEYEDLRIPSEVTIGEDTHKVEIVGAPGVGLVMGRREFKMGLTGFRNIEIPEGVKVLCQAFRTAKISGKVELPSTLTSIEWRTFESSGLTSMPKLPDSLTFVGEHAFINNTNIIGTVRIPGNVAALKQNVFQGCTGITGFDMRMYKFDSSQPAEYYSETEKKYLRAHPTEVVANAPFGAPNVGASNVSYVDEPGPEPKHKVERIITNGKVENKVRLTFQGYTSDDFIMVKAFEKGSGMPDLKNISIQGTDQGGTTNPSTATMEIESKSKSGVQGGNGGYKVKMIFGDRGIENDRRDYYYAAEVDAFKKLKFDLNPDGKAYEGSAPDLEDEFVQGYVIALPEQGSMKVPGYKFTGWNTDKDGKGVPYSAGGEFIMPEEDTTLYAQWTVNNTKTIFDGNGGTWGTEEQKELTGQEGTLFTDHNNYNPTPEHTGHTLLGWSKSKTDPSQRVTRFGSEEQTVYAVWGANDVTVTFDGNALDARVKGKAAHTETGKVGDALKPPTEDETTRTGYKFDGWAETSTGKPVTITKFPNSNKPYYAVWTPKKNTINFTANAAEGTVTKPTKPLQIDSGKKIGVVPEAQAKGGYTFTDHWICSVGNARLTSAQIEDYDVTGQHNNITFTAEFKENDKVYVTYNYDNGVDADGNSFKRFPGTAGSPFVSADQLPTPTKQGWRFDGWDKPKPTVYPNKDEEIFAKWTAKENTVNFVVPNGTADPESIKVITGKPVGVTPKATPDLGYTFNGLWKCDEDNVEYSSQQVAMYPITGARETVTFTAQMAERPDWFALEAAINEGEAKIAGDEKDKYTETSVKALEDAIAHAKDVLNNADSTDEQLIAEKAAIEAAVKALKTKEQQQADDALAKAKEDAKAELDRVNVNLYEEPELSVVKKAIEDGKKEIDAATTIPQVDAAKKKALDIIAAQKTAAQKQAERDAEDKEKDEDPKNIPTEVTDKTPANLVAVTKAITTAKNDGDLKGSTYAPLKFMSKKQTKKSIKLQWSKVKGAKQYTVYANQCGTKNKYKKVATVKGKTLNVKKVAGKKLKKGANYKFLIIAENGDKVSAISKTLHIRTAGHKKYTNYKSVSVKKTVIKKAKKLKKGKTLKLNAKGVVPKGKKVSVHVKTRYESANKKVATVTKAGKVKGIKKGKAKIYCYVQNGLAKVVTVTVK